MTVIYEIVLINPDTNFYGRNDYNDLIPLDYDMDGDGMINSLEIITSSSSYYVDRLAIAANNDPNLIRSAGVFVEDDDMDEDGKKVVFSDDFETNLNQWSSLGWSGSVIQRTNAKAHSGSRSVEVYQTSNDGDTVLYKTFTTQKTGTVTFWFYDNTNVKGTQVVGIKDTSYKFWIGIKGDAKSKYVWRIGTDWHSTSIARSTGWHRIMFVSNGEYTSGIIDNTLIKTTTTIKTFNWVEIGSYWSVTGPGLYFDDVVVTDDFDEDNDGMDNGYEIGYGVANNGWQNPYIYNARYAILVGGGGTYPKGREERGNYPAFWKDTYELYTKLTDDYGYLEENVYLLYSEWLVKHTSTESVVSAGVSMTAYISVDGGDWEIDDGIEKWGKNIKVKVEPSKGTYTFTSENSFHNIISLTLEYDWGMVGDMMMYFLDMNVHEYLWEDHSNNNPDIDGECTSEGVEESLGSIGEKITKNDFIFITFATHGSVGSIFLRRDYESIEASYLDNIFWVDASKTYSDINNVLTDTLHDSYARMCIVVMSCYSDSAISYLSREKRIVIASSRCNEESYTQMYVKGLLYESSATPYAHFAFLHKGSHIYWSWGWKEDIYSGFTLNLGSKDSLSRSIKYAFDKGYDAASNNWFDNTWPNPDDDGRHHPRLDDNGDYIGHEKGDLSNSDSKMDGYLAAHTYL